MLHIFNPIQNNSGMSFLKSNCHIYFKLVDIVGTSLSVTIFPNHLKSLQKSYNIGLLFSLSLSHSPVNRSASVWAPY